eukprot:UN34202
MMLCGCPAYSEQTLTDLKFQLLTSYSFEKENPLKGDLDVGLKRLLEAYKRLRFLSEDVIKLMTRIFCPENDRITMNELLQNEWLRVGLEKLDWKELLPQKEKKIPTNEK